MLSERQQEETGVSLQPESVLIYAMNYAPELIGCGRYTGEIGAYLAQRGVRVEVVTTPPHYPGWEARDGYKAGKYTVETQDNVRINRCPIGLNKQMRGLHRAWAPISFALSSAPVVIWRILATRPSTVYCIEPTLFCAPAVLLAGKLVGAKTVMHVQDLEMDAAFAVGYVKSGWIKTLALGFEKLTLKAFDSVITISIKMRQKLLDKGIKAERINLIRNWVDVEKIFPLNRPSTFRAELGFGDDDFVALYAGNIGIKQALHLVMEAARSLQDQPHIRFVIAGDGPVKESLVAMNLTNVMFLPLQPENRLNDLLNLADVHLLPEDKGATDLVLPSKIGGMLASGKAIIAMADEGSEINNFLRGYVDLVPAGDHASLAQTIIRQYQEAKTGASKLRNYDGILANLMKSKILSNFCRVITRNSLKESSDGKEATYRA